ncbi:hypothetical protein SAMN05216286_3080 [Kosakonia oryzae]|uniref:Uncharacterized protein n=1 Tax=Kosakonia oryzae TaxID=497725 RepID=A0AA94H4Z7_9ENTR|nr:hypothetical protein SAMN05216286_3080 [Kosakonia oryzae]
MNMGNSFDNGRVMKLLVRRLAIWLSGFYLSVRVFCIFVTAWKELFNIIKVDLFSPYYLFELY